MAADVRTRLKSSRAGKERTLPRTGFLCGRQPALPGMAEPPARISYSSAMMRCVRAVHSALARSMSMPGHTPSR